MDIDVDTVCIIKIPKPRVLAKSSSTLIKPQDQRFKRKIKERVRKPSEVSLHKYSLPGESPVPVKTLKCEDVLLSYVQYEKKQNHIRHKQRLSINIYDKFKITNTALRKRLNVDHPPDDVYALTDIDKGFFKNVDGRPLPHHIPLFKSLQFLFHKQLRMRQEIGYRKDAMLKIDANYEKEKQTYESATKICTNQAKYVDRFISEDYQKSMALLRKWDLLKTEVIDKQIELHHFANEMFTIISRLVGLDYKYGLQQKYGRFLYYLSPPTWRLQNREFAHSVEIEAKGFDFGSSSDDDTFTVIFEKMQKECVSNMVKPVLYFTHPDDLMRVYDTIQTQELCHFIHVSRMAPHMKSVLLSKQHLKDLIAQDSATVASTIEGFESLVEFYAERSQQLEARFFQVLNGQFYECVAAPEVLELHLHIEFCYEMVFKEKTFKLEMVVMAKALENFYMEYTKRLENIHSHSIQRAIEQSAEAENFKFRRAKKASRELRLFEQLEKQLLRAFKPMTKDFTPLPTMPCFRSVIRKKLPKPEKIERKRDSLTEAEVDYLTLFTEWTENEDPKLYL